MRLLFLSQRVPYPPNRGDKITTWRLIERFARQHEVRIAAFAHDDQDLAAAEVLRGKGFEVFVVRHRPTWDRVRSVPLLATGKALTLGVFGSRALQNKVDEWAPECDLMYAYSSSMGAFMLPHPKHKRVMHFAELDSDKWRQYSEKSNWPMNWIYRREYRALGRFERELAAAMDENIFCTPLEETIFRERIPGPSSMVVRNGVDLGEGRPRRDGVEPGHLVFVGVMNYYPNVEGCRWFVEEILPAIQKQHPRAHLSIVGSHPTAEVLALAERPGVEVTGFVKDPREYLARAAVSVAPLRIARGIQNKVLEAMSMAVPVVGTTSATQGVEGKAGEDFLVEDELAGQVRAICGLLGDSQAAGQLGMRGRRFVEDHYSWEAVLAPLDTRMDDLLKQER